MRMKEICQEVAGGRFSENKCFMYKVCIKDCAMQDGLHEMSNSAVRVCLPTLSPDIRAFSLSTASLQCILFTGNLYQGVLSCQEMV